MPRFWRRREIREAEKALVVSFHEGREVDRLARAMGARRRQNNFAPMIEQAFRAVKQR